MTQLPASPDLLTKVQLATLMIHAGFDRQRVDQMKRDEIAENELQAIRQQLFDGFMFIGGEWKQPTVNDLTQARQRAEIAVEQAKRDLAFAERVEECLTLVAAFEDRRRQEVTAASVSVEDEPNVVVSSGADQLPAHYGDAAYA